MVARVGFQEGTQRVAPAEFIEAAGKTYLDDLTKAAGGIKTLDMSTILGPQFVAPQTAIQAEAEALRGGLGSFQPFLTTAAASSGPQAYQQFMSPYQQDIIDTTLQEFDVQAAKGIPALAAQAINAGAFGGGREGVQRAEYRSASDRNRAALQAQLLQQGFQQAQNLAAQQFAQQANLAQLSPQLAGQQIAGLSTLGGQQQAQQQATLAAQQQLAQRQALPTFRGITSFRSRCYIINRRIPWKKYCNRIYSSFTKSISNWIRSSFNIGWYLQSVSTTTNNN
jgi:hypothetical protein